MTKVDFYSAYKELRNRWRKYSRESIVAALLEMLAEPVSNPLDDLRRGPWEALLLLKWVMQDGQATDAGLPQISRRQLDTLRQGLHDLPERIELLPEEGSSHILFRQILHAQAGFQRRASKGILREAALLRTLPSRHPLRQLFQTNAGLDENTYCDLVLALFAAIVGEERRIVPSGWFASLEKAYGAAAIGSFKSATSRSYPELVQFFQALPNSNVRKTSELYEFPAIKRYPFLRTDRGLHCWHPMVFLRGTESFVHSIVSEAGTNLLEQFTNLFERHVVDEARRSDMPCIAERELSELVGRDRQVTDVLISLPTANVLVEAKAGLFDESVMVVGDATILAHKTRAIAKAISQGWSISEHIRGAENAPAHVKNSQVDYLLIVTNKELSASNGVKLAMMYPDGHLEYPSDTARRLLPLEHVYVVSIEDFERLMSAVAEKRLDLAAFLQGCVENDREPTTSVFYFDQHLSRAGVKLGFSPVVQQMIDESFDRVTNALSAH